MALLAVAGLLRPEAWVLAGAATGCGALARRGLGQRCSARSLVLRRAASLSGRSSTSSSPATRCFSLHATSDLADELGRERGLATVPRLVRVASSPTSRARRSRSPASSARVLAWRRCALAGAMHVPARAASAPAS